MAGIFEAMETAKDFFCKLFSVEVFQINIIKATKTNEGWEVEALYLGGKYHVVVNDNKEVQSYEKIELK